MEQREINDELVLKVVKGLVGPISPAADSAIDGKRMENLKVLCRVVDNLLYDIDRVAQEKGSQFSSVKGMGEFAAKFLKRMESYTTNQ